MRRSTRGAAPSSAAASLAAPSAVAQLPRPYHPAFPQIRCGIAPAKFLSRRSHPPPAPPRLQLPSGSALPPTASSKRRKPPNALQSVGVPIPKLPGRRRKPVAPPLPGSLRRSLAPGSDSSQLSQLAAELPSRAKQRILNRLLGRPQCVPDRPQLQPLIVLHLKHDALARRQPLHGPGDAHANLVAHQPPFRILRGTILSLPLEKVRDAVLMRGVYLGSLIFGAGLPATQLVQANVGDDAVQPGIKAALETEPVEIAVNLQEGFLINVSGVLWPLHQVQRQPQDVAVVAAHQFLKRSAATRLRLCHQRPFLEVRQRGHRGQGCVSTARTA